MPALPTETIFCGKHGEQGTRCLLWFGQVGSSKALADSLDAATRDGDEYFNKVEQAHLCCVTLVYCASCKQALRILSTRCMQQAVYFCSGIMLYHFISIFRLAPSFFL